MNTKRFRPVGSIAVAVLALACGSHSAPSAGVVATAAPPRPVRPAELRHGIDVSWHSGNVDWRAVRAAGHTFAYIKATEGVNLKDPAFEAHWQSARDVGLIRGAYHFYVTEDDPEEQARFFLSTVHLGPGDLAPVVDVEIEGRETRGDLPARLHRWLDIVEHEVGVRPVIYTEPRFWDAHFDESFAAYPLWVADYGVETPKLPLGWTRWHLWQWREDVAIPGVEKGADVSRIAEEAEALQALVIR